MHMLAHYAKLMHICIMFFMVVFEILPLKKIRKYFASYILAINAAMLSSEAANQE